MQLTIFGLLMTQQSSSGKMSSESCPVEIMLSAPSWRDWAAAIPPSLTKDRGQARVWLLARDGSSSGERWMPNFSESPNDGDECLSSLSAVLHRAGDGVSLTRYYLSAKACKGILRRAEKRGKALPETLRLALIQTIEQSEQ